MIVPPFYDALSWRELLAHYTAVADAIAIPIMYYNLPSASGVTLTAAQLRELPASLPQGHRRRRRRRHRADPDRRPDAAQRLGHAHLRRARRRRPRRRLGRRLDRPRAVRRAAPAADRRHRPPRRARAVGPPLAALPVPRGPELLGRGQDRVPARRRHHGPGPRAAPAARRRGDERAERPARARDPCGGRTRLAKFDGRPLVAVWFVPDRGARARLSSRTGSLKPAERPRRGRVRGSLRGATPATLADPARGTRRRGWRGPPGSRPDRGARACDVPARRDPRAGLRCGATTSASRAWARRTASVEVVGLEPERHPVPVGAGRRLADPAVMVLDVEAVQLQHERPAMEQALVTPSRRVRCRSRAGAGTSDCSGGTSVTEING